MDGFKAEILKKRIERTMENLERNNMEAFFVPDKEDVVPRLSEMISAGSTVTCGGSVSLYQCGVIDFLRDGPYCFLDRDREGLSKEDREAIFRQAFSSDVYLCSSNAVTENGELYNVDGNSNRTAAILYGPKSVIMVVGINKIVRNLDEAVLRVKTVSAPANALRLRCGTFCSEKGYCASLEGKKSGVDICAGCHTDARICCNYVISARQRQKNRIKVLLVGQDLGY